MELFLIIIGIFSIVQFIPKFIAVCMIKYLNGKSRDKMNPIYYLSCDKSLWKGRENDEFHYLPAISTTLRKEDFEIIVRWFKFEYHIAYYYKHADDA